MCPILLTIAVDVHTTTKKFVLYMCPSHCLVMGFTFKVHHRTFGLANALSILCNIGKFHLYIVSANCAEVTLKVSTMSVRPFACNIIVQGSEHSCSLHF